MVLAAAAVIISHQLSIRQIPVLGWNVEWVEGHCLIRSVVPGLGADRAGLRAGDALLQASGKPLATINDLNELYRNLRIGDQLGIVFQRAGTARETVVNVSLYHYQIRYATNALVSLLYCVFAWRTFRRTRTPRSAMFALAFSLLGMALATEFVQIADTAAGLVRQLAMSMAFHLWPPILFHVLWDYPAGLGQPVCAAMGRWRRVIYGPPLLFAMTSATAHIAAYAGTADVFQPAPWGRAIILLPLAAGLAYTGFLITSLAFSLARRAGLMPEAGRRETLRLFSILGIAIAPPLLSGPVARMLNLSPEITPLLRLTLPLLPYYLGHRLVAAHAKPEEADGQ